MILLRKFQLSDRDSLVRLANNPNISRNMRDAFPSPYTLEDADQFIQKVTSEKPNTVFAIQENGIHVGNVGLHPATDVYRRSAELGYIIGEPYWGRGIATRAVEKIVEFGFNELDLVRIYANVFSFNPASARVLEKVAFEYEGRATKAVYKNGAFHDEIRYGLINPIFENLT